MTAPADQFPTPRELQALVDALVAAAEQRGRQAAVADLLAYARVEANRARVISRSVLAQGRTAAFEDIVRTLESDGFVGGAKRPGQAQAVAAAEQRGRELERDDFVAWALNRGGQHTNGGTSSAWNHCREWVVDAVRSGAHVGTAKP